MANPVISAGPQPASVEARIVPQLAKPTNVERHLQPKYLCFRTDYVPDPNRPGKEMVSAHHIRDVNQYTVLKVDDWIKHNPGASTSYIFVSYSRKQFWTQKDEEIESWQKLSLKAKALIKNQVKIDRNHLMDFGYRASKEAEIPAFWVDFACVDEADTYNVNVRPKKSGDTVRPQSHK